MEQKLIPPGQQLHCQAATYLQPDHQWHLTSVIGEESPNCAYGTVRSVLQLCNTVGRAMTLMTLIARVDDGMPLAASTDNDR